MVRQFSVETRGQGLYEITAKVQAVLENSGVEEGLCTIFVRHTSASLVIQENADPEVLSDLWEHRRRGSARELVLHIG